MLYISLLLVGMFFTFYFEIKRRNKAILMANNQRKQVYITQLHNNYKNALSNYASSLEHIYNTGILYYMRSQKLGPKVTTINIQEAIKEDIFSSFKFDEFGATIALLLCCVYDPYKDKLNDNRLTAFGHIMSKWNIKIENIEAQYQQSKRYCKMVTTKPEISKLFELIESNKHNIIAIACMDILFADNLIESYQEYILVKIKDVSQETKDCIVKCMDYYNLKQHNNNLMWTYSQGSYVGFS